LSRTTPQPLSVTPAEPAFLATWRGEVRERPASTRPGPLELAHASHVLGPSGDENAGEAGPVQSDTQSPARERGVKCANSRERATRCKETGVKKLKAPPAGQRRADVAHASLPAVSPSWRHGLSTCVEHQDQAQPSNGAPIAGFPRQAVRNAAEPFNGATAQRLNESTNRTISRTA
jgi:hypothetical protein